MAHGINYEGLPDVIDEAMLERYFLDVLSWGIEYPEEALEALLPLSDRQWHAYKKINQPVGEKIEKWLMSVVDGLEINHFDDAVVIILRLGLTGCTKLFDETLSSGTEERKSVVKKLLSEVGDQIGDPWFGCRGT